ncbi:hypothetical protein C8Q79DRAFT_1012763 [Trametes meyenii]|nr:hypothetical protein C8Q79DRAFT_1012763 [Trametes meyenii]
MTTNTAILEYPYASSSPKVAVNLPFGLPSMDSTLGAIYIGLVIGTMLFGLTIHQTYRYFKLYPNDRFYIKALVIIIVYVQIVVDILTTFHLLASISALEAFHSVLWATVGYHYLISEALNISGLILGHWSVRMTVMETGFSVFACQCFYACRVYLIGPRYRWLVAPAAVVLVVGLGFAISAGVEAFIYAHYITDFKHVSWLVSAAYGFAVAADVILTGALVFVLRKARTGSKRSDPILDVLTIYTINTGLLTSIVSIAVFIFALILPGNLIYAGISIVGAKLYANSVLAVLNSRKSIDNCFMDDFTSFSVGARSRDPTSRTTQFGGDIESMVYHIPQMRSCASELSTTSQGASLATGMGADSGVHKEHDGR